MRYVPNPGTNRGKTVLSCTAVAGLAGFLSLGLAGCPQTQVPAGTDGTSTKAVLKPFDSRADLLSYFAAQATSSRSSAYGNGFFAAEDAGVATSAAGGAAPPSSPSPTSGGDAASNGASADSLYSTTNLQEQGVDESDVVKSDGRNFYIARNNSLRIVRAEPGQPLAELGKLELENAISELYLTDSGLLALGYSYGTGYGAQTLIYPPYYSGAGTVVYQIDISDPTKPAVLRQVTLDGSLATSRVVNNRLILVLTIYPNIAVDVQSSFLGIPTGVSTASAEQALPKIATADGSTEVVAWEDWLHPDPADGYEMTVVAALDASNIETVISSTGIVAGAQTIYASPNALYITDSDYNAANSYRENTNIHKLTFEADGSVRYVASGAVPGRPLNQFSLSEFNGNLRIATHIDNITLFPPVGVPLFMSDIVLVDAGASSGTSSDASPPSSGGGSSGSADTPVSSDAVVSSEASAPNSYNGVNVLGESDGELTVLGQIDNIAPNERIYAARFIEKRGYLVTFRQIDPLFSMDLSNPAAPRVTGELKIPGYSDYLHPLDDTHLIGVGRSVVNFPQGFSEPGGVQLSLFDVSDPNNPQVVQQIVLGGYGSSTDVSYTHKAFVYQPQLKILAIPVQLSPLSNDFYSYGYPTFDGVVAFNVNPESGFTEVGRLSSVLNSNSYYYYPAEGGVAGGSTGAPTTIAPGAPDYLYGYASWRRPAIIANSLYAITDAGVSRADLGDLAHPESLGLNP